MSAFALFGYLLCAPLLGYCIGCYHTRRDYEPLINRLVASIESVTRTQQARRVNASADWPSDENYIPDRSP